MTIAAAWLITYQLVRLHTHYNAIIVDSQINIIVWVKTAFMPTRLVSRKCQMFHTLKHQVSHTSFQSRPLSLSMVNGNSSRFTGEMFRLPVNHLISISFMGIWIEIFLNYCFVTKWKQMVLKHFLLFCIKAVPEAGTLLSLTYRTTQLQIRNDRRGVSGVTLQAW